MGSCECFPPSQNLWPDVGFRDLRGQGAFLVSAKKESGVTRFDTVKSLAGSPCVAHIDILKPKIVINGSPRNFP